MIFYFKINTFSVWKVKPRSQIIQEAAHIMHTNSLTESNSVYEYSDLHAELFAGPASKW